MLSACAIGAQQVATVHFDGVRSVFKNVIIAYRIVLVILAVADVSGLWPTYSILAPLVTARVLNEIVTLGYPGELRVRHGLLL